MKIEEYLDKIKEDGESLSKLKTRLDCLINEHEIMRINKKYIRLLEKKDEIVECETKKKRGSEESDSDKFWKKHSMENHTEQLLKIEKQLGATLSYFKFEKLKCNITENDPSGNEIGFGSDEYDAYKASHPNQLYYYNLHMEISIFSHTIKIINSSTATILNPNFTMYFVDDDQIDSRIFFGGYAHSATPVIKLHKKLKQHKHIFCEYEAFLEVLTSIVNTFPKLIKLKETSEGFTEHKY